MAPANKVDLTAIMTALGGRQALQALLGSSAGSTWYSQLLHATSTWKIEQMSEGQSQQQLKELRLPREGEKFSFLIRLLVCED